MTKLIFPRSASFALLLALVFSDVAHAKGIPFILLESHKRTVTKTELETLESAHSKATVSENRKALILPDNPADLIIRTGPESDMLSYRVQGIRNPTLVIRTGSSLHILFVNVDDDMPHDLRFGDVEPPDTIGTAGTVRLPQSEDDTYSAEDITIRTDATGKFPYFCSYRSHAANGMRGWIIVAKSGATPDEMKQLAMDSSGMSGSMGMEGMNGMGEMQMGNTQDMHMEHAMAMTGLLRTEPMSQDGSGTSWLPASSPMYMWMTIPDDWTLMLHGAIMPRYDHQGGPRGANKFDAPNWFMGMAGHPVGNDGQFTARLMMSLDPPIEGGMGYPLLLQTGETWQSVKLVDRQHPHDLFDEVSATYSQRLAEKSSVYLYLGYPGEPALGPPVFMHRPSAMSNPNAPISHHWMDATHITFGVATAGVTMGDWKLEGSYFNGREPDENRYDFDPLKLNSYSGRLSFNPTDDLAVQVSSGFIKNPESDGVDVIRTTASAIYTREFENNKWWSTTAAWGQNHEVSGETLQAFLLESQYDWMSWTAYGRGEYVQKTNSEFNLPTDPMKINDVEAVTLGLTSRLFTVASLDLEVGAQGMMSVVPPSLEPLYSKNPISYEVYVSLHPSFSQHNM